MRFINNFWNIRMNSIERLIYSTINLISLVLFLLALFLSTEASTKSYVFQIEHCDTQNQETEAYKEEKEIIRKSDGRIKKLKRRR